MKKALLLSASIILFISCKKSLKDEMQGSWLHYANIVDNNKEIVSEHQCPVIETYKSANYVQIDRYGGYNCEGVFSSIFNYTIDKNKVTYTSDVGTQYADYIVVEDTILKKVYDITHNGKPLRSEKIFIKIPDTIQ